MFLDLRLNIQDVERHRIEYAIVRLLLKFIGFQLVLVLRKYGFMIWSCLMVFDGLYALHSSTAVYHPWAIDKALMCRL
jgi:hypothetical protein